MIPRREIIMINMELLIQRVLTSRILWAPLEALKSSYLSFQVQNMKILQFNTFEAMFSGMDKKKSKKSSKTRGRAKGRSKNNLSSKQMNQLTKLMMMGGMGMGGDDLEMDPQLAMLQTMLAGGMIDPDQLEGMQKQLQKMILESDGDEDGDEDQQDLTKEEMQILQFGQKNIEKKKVGKKKKKTQIKCKFDGQKVEQDQILMHFSQKHMQQFKKWQKQNKEQPKQNSKTEKQTCKKENKQQQEIQY